MSGGWIGPYGVIVSQNINSVVAKDGENTLYKDGTETEVYVTNHPTEQEWLAKYSYISNNMLFYKGPDESHLDSDQE
jgi:hypothetical protein